MVNLYIFNNRKYIVTFSFLTLCLINKVTYLYSKYSSVILASILKLTFLEEKFVKTISQLLVKTTNVPKAKAYTILLFKMLFLQLKIINKLSDVIPQSNQNMEAFHLRLQSSGHQRPH